MTSLQFLRCKDLSVHREELFRWHARPGAFERLNPPWVPITLIAPHSGLENGTQVAIRFPVGPFRQNWVFEHRSYREGEQFQDVLIKGPFRKWEHLHRMIDNKASGSILEDLIEYELPLRFVTHPLMGQFIHRELDRVFRYRHIITEQDLGIHRGVAPKRIAITGSSGFVGSSLVPFLTAGGHHVIRLVRHPPNGPHELRCGAHSDLSALNGFDAIIHLAGEGIATGRWTESKKLAIAESRVRGTRSLVDKLIELPSPPKVFISASAVGIYGNRGDEELSESSPPGSGFLPEVAKGWEEASKPLDAAGVRHLSLRFGIVLSPQGGALQRMILPFRFGIGGPLGHGRQWISWIALEDLVRVIYRAITDDSFSGEVNAVAPNPLTNEEFSHTLGSVLHRPSFLRVPRRALKLAFAEMADAALLVSQRVVPEKLRSFGFQFLFPDLEGALRFSLGRELTP